MTLQMSRLGIPDDEADPETEVCGRGLVRSVQMDLALSREFHLHAERHVEVFDR